jgi:hypothetical protein
MLGRIRRRLTLGLCTLLAACGMVTRCSVPEPLDGDALERLYAERPAPPEAPLQVYHLGHSLVGRDMPAMLEQMAEAGIGSGHAHASQLGWGASLKAHWEPDETVNGFDEMNGHDRHRPAYEAVDSGEYDAVVLTEMVEIKAAIEWHASWDYLARWAKRIWAANPEVRVYFYESWHPLDDPEGWLLRLDRDLGTYWEGEILFRTLAADGVDRPIHLIPAGQVMAAFARRLEALGGIGNLTNREDLFGRRSSDGTLDPIHFSDAGAYLVALTHYAVLYGKSPVGLPHALLRADGSPAKTPGPEAARAMQETVWDVVTTTPRTGL